MNSAHVMSFKFYQSKIFQIWTKTKRLFRFRLCILPFPKSLHKILHIFNLKTKNINLFSNADSVPGKDVN